ncbi:MAG: AMP-binding protein, partial [Nocardioidaceae bacterium]
MQSLRRWVQWAQIDGSRPALVCGDDEIDHSVLDRRVAGLARELHDLGIGRGDVVAIALPLGRDAVIGVLGVLRAGAAYVPLEPADPPERLAA